MYDTKAVTIVEVMGRNAGWLTAASALARIIGAEGPSLIYLCEPHFQWRVFFADVKGKLEKQDSVLVAISEESKDKDGVYISEQVQSGPWTISVIAISREAPECSKISCEEKSAAK